MAGKSNIEWCTDTWNPVVGCSIVSPGCTNCYAMKQAARIQRMAEGSGKWSHYNGTTKRVNGNEVWTGRVTLAPDHILLAPLKWKTPRKIFVNSMGDLFHESVPDEWIDKVFAVMALCPQHTFQCLTKRSDRMKEYMSKPERQGHVAFEANELYIKDKRTTYGAAETALFKTRVPGSKTFGTIVRFKNWPLPNVWLGVSAEDQTHADERIADLLATPAAIRFVSAEPLLGPIDFTNIVGSWNTTGKIEDTHSDMRTNTLTGQLVARWNGDQTTIPQYEKARLCKLDWIIAGGESGHGARPMHPDWVRSIRDQCEAAGTAFFFKQWGEWAPGESCDHRVRGTEQIADWINGQWSYGSITRKQSEETHIEDEPELYRVGKAKAGNLLEGKTHNQFPEVK
jgi:protein gp37